MFAAVPVAASVLAILGAFEVLAVIYAPTTARPFLLVVGAGSVFGVVITSLVIGDATTLHPRTLSRADFDAWRARQWLKDRRAAYDSASRVTALGVTPPVLALVVRYSGVNVPLTAAIINTVIYSGIAIGFAGALGAAYRTKHPESGNNQRSLGRWEAGVATLAIGLFSAFVLAVLPAA